MNLLDTVEINPPGAAQASVIWMHGLGADAHDFGPVVPALGLPAQAGVRFVFPNAPMLPVTVNGGMIMRAWYDVLSIDLPQREDSRGIAASADAVRALIENEQARGVASGRIVLAGFSQGGAMALHAGLRHPQRLAGILALSAYIPLARQLHAGRHEANAGIPVFIAHGSRDGVIPLRYGRAAAEELRALGHDVEWRVYPMAHEVCLEEVADIGRWLARVLGAG
ncbi:MAG: alpha/beta hydrolase [Pseudomonadota bacterium]|nr:alpha/beta hydrolase [Pseudomonadota bacterium]